MAEARFSEEESKNLPLQGDLILAETVLEPGDIIDAKGKSKGKGFAGGVKRYGFHGGPKTHGQSDRHRAPGSIGSGTTPGRVYKGKRMAGKMGNDMVTLKNLEVVKVGKDFVWVKGVVPGPVGSIVVLSPTGKKNKKFVEVLKTEEEQAVIDAAVLEAAKQEALEVEKAAAEQAKAAKLAEEAASNAVQEPEKEETSNVSSEAPAEVISEAKEEPSVKSSESEKSQEGDLSAEPRDDKIEEKAEESSDAKAMDGTPKEETK